MSKGKKPAKVSTEVETKTILYKYTRNVTFKLGIFEHDLASFGVRLIEEIAPEVKGVNNQLELAKNIVSKDEAALAYTSDLIMGRLWKEIRTGLMAHHLQLQY